MKKKKRMGDIEVDRLFLVEQVFSKIDSSVLFQDIISDEIEISDIDSRIESVKNILDAVDKIENQNHEAPDQSVDSPTSPIAESEEWGEVYFTPDKKADDSNPLQSEETPFVVFEDTKRTLRVNEESLELNIIKIKNRVLRMTPLPLLEELSPEIIEAHILAVSHETSCDIKTIKRLREERSLEIELSSNRRAILLKFLDGLDLSVLEGKKLLFFPVRDNSNSTPFRTSLEESCRITILYGIDFSNPDFTIMCPDEIKYYLTLQAKELFDDCGLIVSIEVSFFSRQVHILFQSPESVDAALSKADVLSTKIEGFKATRFDVTICQIRPVSESEHLLNYEFSNYTPPLYPLYRSIESLNYSGENDRSSVMLFFRDIFACWYDKNDFMSRNSSGKWIVSIIESHLFHVLSSADLRKGKVDREKRTLDLRLAEYNGESLIRDLSAKEFFVPSLFLKRKMGKVPRIRLKFDLSRECRPFSRRIRINVVMKENFRGRPIVEEITTIQPFIREEIEFAIDRCLYVEKQGQNKLYKIQEFKRDPDSDNSTHLIITITSSNHSDVLKLLSLDLTEIRSGEKYVLSMQGRNLFLDVSPVPVAPYFSQIDREKFCIRILPPKEYLGGWKVEYLRLKFLMNKFGLIFGMEEKERIWYVHFVQRICASKLRGERYISFMGKRVKLE